MQIPCIRLATLNDLVSIDEIYNEAIAQKFKTADTIPFDWQQRVKWFQEHPPNKYPVWVAEVDGRVWGWVSLSPYRPGRKALEITAEISYYIHSSFQRKGIGSALLKFALRAAPDYNIKNILAILMDRNMASVKLLEKFQFKQWGHLRNVACFGDDVCGQFYYGINLR
jgi:L-amino acid N-acyltransferase YncA